MEKKETKSGSYKSHVLVLPFPLQGHINPMLQFSKRLASKGVKATLVTTVHVARSSAISASSDDDDNLVQIETISDGYDQGGYAAAESDEAYVTSLKRVGSATLAQLINKLADWGQPVNGLVYDSVMIWALDVAKRFGIFKVPFFTQSCAVNSVYYHVNKGLLQLPLSGDVVSLPGLPPLGRFDVPSFLNDVGSYPAIFDSVVGQFNNVDEADWVLFNTFYELEPEVVDWMRKLYRISTIGPMVPASYLKNKRTQTHTHHRHTINLFKPNTTTCATWLDTKPPNSVVYVSFGSLAALTADQTNELSLALTQTNYNFLWVVRESEQPKLPEKLTTKALEKGLVVTWCDQLEVLAHGAVGCFVTHCGFNSVLEAMSLGVPVLGVPMWTDQCTNGFFVEEVWGNGVRARPGPDGVVGRGEMGERLRELMEGDKGKMVKKNAIRWRDLAREAVGEGGSSDKNIDEFVANLV